MKTLEELVKEHSNVVFSNDEKVRALNSELVEWVEEDYKAGYNEAMRWRYANVEAPDNPCEVLVRSTKGNHAIATYTNLTGWVLKPSIKGFGTIAKWRPIE